MEQRSEILIVGGGLGGVAGALLMSLSTVIVAVNAMLLRRVRL